MTKEQVLTTLNERLAKRNFKATIVRFDRKLQHCRIIVTDKNSYLIAVMSVSFDFNKFNVYMGNICGLPNQFVDAYNLIEKGEL